MEINFLALLLAALSTLVVGFIWYNPKVFGTIWMKESGLTEEKMKGANMALLFGLSFFYAFLISTVIQMLVIHQMGAISMIGGFTEISTAKPSFSTFMADYGTTFRTFEHGAFHGLITGIFLAIPLVGTTALFERRSWKYILISGGYWTVCFMIMGGIICSMK